MKYIKKFERDLFEISYDVKPGIISRYTGNVICATPEEIKVMLDNNILTNGYSYPKSESRKIKKFLSIEREANKYNL